MPDGENAPPAGERVVVKSARERLHAYAADVETLGRLLNADSAPDPLAYASFSRALDRAWEGARRAARDYVLEAAVEAGPPEEREGAIDIAGVAAGASALTRQRELEKKGK